MGSTTGSNIFGGITFVLIVALALAAIAVMIYGRYLKQRRLAGEKELIERREAAHVETVIVEPEAPIAETPEELAPTPVEAVDDVPVAAVPAAKAKAAPKVKAAPKAEVAAPTASPKAEAAPAPMPASDGDITQLKGLGPKLATTLAELGYTRLDQIAALTPDQAADLDARLGNFQGRLARDRWIEQARLLVAGDRAAYEAAFGKLG